MIKALNTAATGMVAQQTNIDVIANNMANVNTTGFKKSRAEFQDLIYQTIRSPGATLNDGSQLPTGIQIGQGTRTVSTEFIHTQGSFEQTGNQLDMAIEGNGFFQVVRPSGQINYTRAGNFKVDANGRLTSVDGFGIEPAINIPPDAASISIASDGTISVTQAGQTTSQQVGQVQIATFPNTAGLRAMGRGLFIPSDASGTALVTTPGQDGAGTLAQGFLEGSNVQVVNEMIDLISSQRAYEVNQRVVQAADDMLRKTAER